MKKVVMHNGLAGAAAFAAVLLLLCAAPALAHFGVLVPSDDIVGANDIRVLTISLKFMHPFEGQYMEVRRPKAFGVLVRDQRTDLLPALREKEEKGVITWEASYRVRRPGDHIFYMEPVPYWEPAEETFIVHYTKVIVSALGLEDHWGKTLGLKTEIVPLTRPYGLWAGNVFQGAVLLDGKPVPHARVEVEYLAEGTITPPEDSFMTQVIRADTNGVFTYAMPREGWWGFAALHDADYTLEHNGNLYPVELGAVFWVHVTEMPR